MSYLKGMFKFVAIAVILLQITCNKNLLYDQHNSNVINLNKKNFDTQITANRAKNVVSIVHYYTTDDNKSKELKVQFEKLAADYDGMFKVGGLNCKEFKDICEKQEIREYPTFKVYPPLPAPPMNYEGKVEVAALVTYLGRFFNNKAVELNNNNIDNYVSEDPNLPKVILFTDKKGVPLIFKALSVLFDVYIVYNFRKKLN